MSFLDPREAINHLDLKPDMVGAEFGCGSGVFAIELAKRLPEGIVYGLDIQQEPLSALDSQARLEKLRNIRAIRCDLEAECGSGLPDESLDIVLIPNLLFQVEDKSAIIKEAHRVLKRGGQTLVIDWLPEASAGPAEGRASLDEVKQMAEQLGFTTKQEFPAGAYHWGVVVVKLS